MIKVKDQQIQTKIEQLYAMGQGHIFRFWDELTDEQREHFLSQIRQLDLSLLSRLIDFGLDKEKSLVEKYRLAPTDVLTLKKRRHRDQAIIPVGEEALRKGQVAAFLVAGGQGSRLGFDGPKGCFPITPVRHKILFQLHAEKILALNKKYETQIPWYIMTSSTNHKQTVECFQKHEYFGLNPQDISFFIQDMLPAIDKKGKLLLAKKDSLFLSPNGHGGSVKALWDSGSIADMRKRGIRYIFYFQVDNVLVNICDPAFIGYHIAARADMSNKVIRKKNPEERLGIICKINGQEGVVEYSDLSREDMYARTEDGRLKYWAGSIAIHMLNVEFVALANEHGFNLPYHKALKVVPYMDEKGHTVRPVDKNGIKFETFVFDLLLQAGRIFTMEVKREEEFSPVKNATGEDSPKTAQDDLLRVYANWLIAAGIDIELNEQGLPLKKIEISPTFALTRQDVIEKSALINEIYDPFYLE